MGVHSGAVPVETSCPDVDTPRVRARARHAQPKPVETSTAVTVSVTAVAETVSKKVATSRRRVKQKTKKQLSKPVFKKSGFSDRFSFLKRFDKHFSGVLENFPHLLAVKPRERYVFHSDYFQIDDGYACVLGFFHNSAAHDDFISFWGINRIPVGLGDGVSTVLFEQVVRMGEKWIDSHLKSSETIGNFAEKEGGITSGSRRDLRKNRTDLDGITAELQDGASYLHVHNRLLVKAPTLESLDNAVAKIRRLYVDRFGTLSVAAYPGEQRQELTKLFLPNEKKRGKGFHYTSVEFAGSHSLVTNGLNDVRGEYVGYMIGDVNNSAVLFDVDGYEHHTVVASNAVNPVLGRVPEANLWGSKLSQAALLNNHKVVHLVLDGTDLDVLGPRLDSLTARVNMSEGDINFLEMFGDLDDELAIFPSHLDKVVLMADQIYHANDSEKAIIKGSLRETLTQFYVDKQMWYHDAKNNRDRLRLVGLDHTHVPRLQDLVSYFHTAYTSLAVSATRDDEMLHAFSVLRLIFKDILDTNGALFNTYTNARIDGVGSARRVVYNFSDLMMNNEGVAMAQLINVFNFSIAGLGLRDVVIIHGTEMVKGDVLGYVGVQLEKLFRRGGRVVFLYNDIEKMLTEQDFNRFDAADYTIIGNMRDGVVADYQERLHNRIPMDLEKLIVSRDRQTVYLRRGHTNVVFQADLALGVNPKRELRKNELQQLLPPIPPHNGSAVGVQE